MRGDVVEREGRSTESPNMAAAMWRAGACWFYRGPVGKCVKKGPCGRGMLPYQREARNPTGMLRQSASKGRMRAGCGW